MKIITNDESRIMVPKKIIIKKDETIEDVINRIFFVRGKNKYNLVVLHRNRIVCPLCKSKSNCNGISDYGSQQYICGNKECRHPFVPNKTLPDAEHPIYEMIKGVEDLYKKKMSLRKASDYLKTKNISISYYGVMGWKRVVPDILRALLNSLKPESDDKSAIDAVKSIKKSLSWLKPWRRYEYAKVSTYTPRGLLKSEIKSGAIESHVRGDKIILNINKPCTIEINKEDRLTQRITMALLNNSNLASSGEIANVLDVSEPTVTSNTKKYLEGGSSNLVDKRGGSESKLTPTVMEKITYHLLDSYFKSEKINNSIIAKRVNSELENNGLKISREIVRQFHNALNFDKTFEKLNLIKNIPIACQKKTKIKR